MTIFEMILVGFLAMFSVPLVLIGIVASGHRLQKRKQRLKFPLNNTTKAAEGKRTPTAGR